MVDSMALADNIASKHSNILSRFDLSPEKYLLVTVHRAENTDKEDRLLSILTVLNDLNETIILTIHPRTKKITEKLGFKFLTHVIPIEPLGYIDMIALERSARIILTDSEGIQKEAYWLGVPCITLRYETEWVETVEAKWNILAGANYEKIIETVELHKKPEKFYPLYGDGMAAERLAKIIKASIVC
jgi:UDP-GlcNAc3NAcA epimerase